jgi:hypothetical protein
MTIPRDRQPWNLLVHAGVISSSIIWLPLKARVLAFSTHFLVADRGGPSWISKYSSLLEIEIDGLCSNLFLYDCTPKIGNRSVYVLIYSFMTVPQK